MTNKWQHTDLPEYQYDISSIYSTLSAIEKKQAFIQNKLSRLANKLQLEVLITSITEETVRSCHPTSPYIKTDKANDTHVNRSDIVSSIKNELLLNQPLAC